MTKIIEKHDEHIKKPMQFTCGNCGTVFETDEWENKQDEHNDLYYVAKCPNCFYRTYFEAI
jgi:DNA-directed RNA polymerase subunit RPC12/RpoP